LAFFRNWHLLIEVSIGRRSLFNPKHRNYHRTIVMRQFIMANFHGFRNINRAIGYGAGLSAIIALTSCAANMPGAQQPDPQPSNPASIGGTATTASPKTPAIAAQPNSATAKPSGTVKPSGSVKPAQPSASLVSGEYCYSLFTPNLSAEARINLKDSNVSGDVKGMIHNKTAGYFTGYSQALKGTMKGDQADVALDIAVDGDKQTAQETWTITDSTLKTKRETFGRVDCGDLGKLEEKSRAAMSPKAPGKAPNANNPSTTAGERIQFGMGGSSALLKGSVVRGERKVYTLNAAKGQTMTMTITSPEDNAVFAVIGPDGKQLKQEESNTSLVLPASGDYQVSVGGMRGNTTYDLTVTIK
jgi:hypothetical protein